MKNLRQLLHRAGLLSSARGRSDRHRPAEATKRRLGNEVLEKRELLAGDILASHNGWNAYDVNDDGAITARDALGVINYLSRSGEGEQVSPAGPQMFYDVNADQKITASDALGVINAISRGEEVGELVELLLTVRDLNDQQILPDANGEINLEVGQLFDLEVSYDDLRLFNQRLGVFQIFTDIAVSQPNVLVPVLNETQRLIIDETILSVGSTSVNFSIPESPPGVVGGSLTYVSPINSFGNNTLGEVSKALQAFGYTTSQFEISSLDFGNNDLGFQIHWIGDQFGNVDLPDISVDVIESNPADNIPTQTVEFAPFLADGVTPNSEAVRFNINSFSRTFNATAQNPIGEQFYASQNRGAFSPTTGFAGAGGLGQVPVQGGGIPQLTDDGSFIEPFDAFSLRVFVKSAVTDLIVGVNPGEDPESILLYGRDDAVPPDMVLIQTVDTNGNGIAQVVINATSNEPGVLAISPTSVSVNEAAGTVQLTVTRTDGSNGAVSVDFTTANGTATAGSDFTATSGTLNFANGETTKTITIPITDDDDTEDSETFTVTLSNATGGATLGASVATVTITDNDVVMPGVLAFSVGTATVAENGATVTLTVNRTGGSDGSVTVDYATAGGTATAGADFTSTMGTLSFADGETSKTISVPILDDDVDEADETFTVTLSNPAGGAVLGAIVTSTVTITDNDEPPQPGQFNIDPTSINVNEVDGTVTLTVLRSSGSDGEVTVDFATASGTATSGEDFTANSGTLTFADGETSKSIVVAILNDEEDEASETFTVTLSNAVGGATLGTAIQATVTILDDDNPAQPGVFTIAPAAVSVDEDSGTVAYVISRTNGSDGDVTVRFATSDVTATAGQDYTANSGTLVFEDGETSKTITVSIINDAIDEADETFNVTLSNPTGGAVLGNTTVSVTTIVDDDVTPVPGVLSIAPGSVSVDENAGTVSFTVNRTVGSDGAVNVDFATANGTATAGQDYTANSGTLNFANGETSKTITVSIINDSIDEPDETFTVTLSNATGGASLGTISVSTVTIVDDDPTPVPGVLSIAPGSVSVNENAGTVSFTVNRTVGSDGTVGVNFSTANGTATAGADFVAASGTLTFANGETSKTITVSIINDSIDEPDETFTVTLSNATGGASLGTISVSTVTIVDDDPTPVPGVLSIAPGSVSVNENAGTVSFTVNRTGGSDGTVGVNFSTANGTATAGADFVAASGTLTFANGETSKTITVSIIDDAIDEPNETFTVNLSGASGGATLGTSTSTVTILDNDEAGVPVSSISGSVFIDHVENLQSVIAGAAPIRNGVKDSDENGLGGVEIRLVSAANENSTGLAISKTTLTDLDGSLTFDDLAPGTYRVVYDVPSMVIFVGASELVRTIPTTGNVDLVGANFPVLGTQGAALNNVDILASSYLRTNATISQISNGGREGGLVAYDAQGNQEFLIAFSGYEGVKFAEFALSNDQDSALLTIIEEDGDILSALLSSDHFVVSADGRGVQFFGGLNDLNFVDADSMIPIVDEFPTYRDAIDRVLAEL